MKAPSRWPPGGYRPARRLAVDFESPDGRRVLDLKLGAQGVRDLHGALTHLALLLADNPSIEQACLVIRFPRLTLESARDAWRRAKALLRPAIARRLALVLLVRSEEEPWFEPRTEAVAAIAHAVSGSAVARPTTAPMTSPASPKFFEVWKVLLEAWLRQRRPFHINQLGSLAGCSYPTTARAVELLRSRGELTEESQGGHIALRAFPKRTFEQGAGLSDTLRQTRWFADASGRPHDPLALLQRLQRARLPALAVGGVLGARRLDPQFDLHGTPRLDIAYWTPRGAPYDLDLLKAVDPALRPSHSKEDAILAVHRLSRAENLFERAEGEPYPFADPVEVLLDLHDLRLQEQADALVRRLRQGKGS